MGNQEILHVENLKTYFNTDDGMVKAVDGVSFTLNQGETLGIVGESGCGKSVTNLSVMRLIPSPPGKIMGGDVFFHGKSVLSMSEDALRDLRGNKISMIFQDPMTSLNPFLRISTQLVETLCLHQGLPNDQARKKAIQMLRMVGIPSPEKRIDAYPHQFSGGMRQRVGLARALMVDPEILLMDEPFGSLDAQTRESMQDELLKIWELQRKTVVFSTHSVEEAIYMSDRVVMMTPRPGHVKEIVDVKLPRPRQYRDRVSPEFMDLRLHIWERLSNRTDFEPKSG